MQDFRDVKVWAKAHEVALRVYAVTRSFPREEVYALTSQLRRAATSVPTNIAEGCGRATDRDFAQFLQVAFGSACEVDYLLLLARDLGYLDERAYPPLAAAVAEVRRMLNGLIQSVRSG